MDSGAIKKAQVARVVNTTTERKQTDNRIIPPNKHGIRIKIPIQKGANIEQTIRRQWLHWAREEGFGLSSVSSKGAPVGISRVGGVEVVVVIAFWDTITEND